jgi:hypothetical protein
LAIVASRAPTGPLRDESGCPGLMIAIMLAAVRDTRTIDTTADSTVIEPSTHCTHVTEQDLRA